MASLFLIWISSQVSQMPGHSHSVFLALEISVLYNAEADAAWCVQKGGVEGSVHGAPGWCAVLTAGGGVGERMLFQASSPRASV